MTNKEEEVKKTTTKSTTKKTAPKKTTTKTTAKATPKKDTAEQDMLKLAEEMAKKMFTEMLKQQEQTSVEDKVEEKPKSRISGSRRKQLVKIDQNEIIACRSNVTNELIYKSEKSNAIYRWNEFGSYQEIPYGELVSMRSASPKFLTDLLIIIEDDEVVEALRLEDKYEDLIEFEDLDELFELNNEDLKEVLNKMPHGLKKSIANESRKRVQNGTLSDFNKLNILEDILKVELEMWRKR